MSRWPLIVAVVTDAAGGLAVRAAGRERRGGAGREVEPVAGAEERRAGRPSTPRAASRGGALLWSPMNAHSWAKPWLPPLASPATAPARLPVRPRRRCRTGRRRSCRRCRASLAPGRCGTSRWRRAGRRRRRRRSRWRSPCGAPAGSAHRAPPRWGPVGASCGPHCDRGTMAGCWAPAGVDTAGTAVPAPATAPAPPSTARRGRHRSHIARALHALVLEERPHRGPSPPG